MLSTEEKIAEIKALNLKLGLPENEGIPLTYEQKIEEISKLDEVLASTPESFDEYVTRRKQEDSRSIGEKTSAFTDSLSLEPAHLQKKVAEQSSNCLPVMSD